MSYKVTATLGPSSSEKNIWVKMLNAGVDEFRLNTSHVSLSQFEIWLEKYSHFYQNFDKKPNLILDLQGSKWRIGEISEFELISGEQVIIIDNESSNGTGVLPVPHADFFKAAEISSGEIVLNDAKCRLRIDTLADKIITADVIEGGLISSRKGIAFPDSDFRKEDLTIKDQEILEISRKFDFVRFAISYIKDAAEMQRYRSLLGGNRYLIAKIERKNAIEEIESIAELSNEIWVCRGDLGVEMGLIPMAQALHKINSIINGLKTNVILAGQVLEHMVKEPAPTRSEVCGIYNALQNGFTGFVLSDETAIGQFPVESCKIAALFK